MYKAQNQQGGAQGGDKSQSQAGNNQGGQGNKGGGTENVTDVDFEEVK